jgi:hypothetical protein
VSKPEEEIGDGHEEHSKAHLSRPTEEPSQEETTFRKLARADTGDTFPYGRWRTEIY